MVSVGWVLDCVPQSMPGEAYRTSVRKIIHIDCDCFYAAIEMRDDPQLAGRPLAVGGAAERRGVIATCNYEARAWGVRSAMPTRQALKLCPDLLVVKPRMEAYRLASRQIHAILREYSERIEPLSLDEAYVDVSEASHCGGSATRMAREIRQRVWQELRITVSAGVAPNKFLAKIASDWRKPNGLFVITPDEVEDFVAALPVSRLHGVGKVTADKLSRLGITLCSDLREWDKLALLREFGSFGERLWGLARGIDERAVEADSRRQSVSVEHTFDSASCWPACSSCRGFWNSSSSAWRAWTTATGRASPTSRSSFMTSPRPPWSRVGPGAIWTVTPCCSVRPLPVVASRYACWALACALSICARRRSSCSCSSFSAGLRIAESVCRWRATGAARRCG